MRTFAIHIIVEYSRHTCQRCICKSIASSLIGYARAIVSIDIVRAVRDACDACQLLLATYFIDSHAPLCTYATILDQLASFTQLHTYCIIHIIICVRHQANLHAHCQLACMIELHTACTNNIHTISLHAVTSVMYTHTYIQHTKSCLHDTTT